MQKWLKLLCILCLSISVLVGCSSPPDGVDSNGKIIRLSDYIGKWVVINYWATWCKPCLNEIPTLNKLYRQHSKDVMVIGVSFDGLTNDQLKTIQKEYKVKYPFMSRLRLDKVGVDTVSVLPVTFIINPNGYLIKTLKGPQTEKQLLDVMKADSKG